MINGSLGVAIVVCGLEAQITVVIVNLSSNTTDVIHRCKSLDEHLDRQDDRIIISHCGLSCTACMLFSAQLFLVVTWALQESYFCETISDSRIPSVVMMSRMRYTILFILRNHLMERIPTRRDGFHCWRGSRMFTDGY